MVEHIESESIFLCSEIYRLWYKLFISFWISQLTIFGTQNNILVMADYLCQAVVNKYYF